MSKLKLFSAFVVCWSQKHTGWDRNSSSHLLDLAQNALETFNEQTTQQCLSTLEDALLKRGTMYYWQRDDRSKPYDLEWFTSPTRNEMAMFINRNFDWWGANACPSRTAARAVQLPSLVQKGAINRFRRWQAKLRANSIELTIQIVAHFYIKATSVRDRFFVSVVQDTDKASFRLIQSNLPLLRP